MKLDAVWEELLEYPLDDPEAGFSFSRRLAQENGWSREFTERVVVEYKKFLYLVSRSQKALTPSDEVDQAWHLHLCYTRSYWQEVCGKILQKEIHHGPTKGGKAEEAKFEHWYERTKTLYQKTFGEKPPADIWPMSEVRFGRVNFERVDRDANLVVSRKVVFGGGVLFAVGLGLSGCSGDSDSVGILGLAFVMLAILTVVINAGKKSKKGRRGGNGNDAGAAGGFFGSGGNDWGSDDGGSDGGSGCSSGSSGCGGGGCGGGCGS